MEELDDLIAESEDEQQPLARALVNSTLNELVDKWETVVTSYMNFGKARFDRRKGRPCMSVPPDTSCSESSL